jgi:hypothetical protein
VTIYAYMYIFRDWTMMDLILLLQVTARPSVLDLLNHSPCRLTVQANS